MLNFLLGIALFMTALWSSLALFYTLSNDTLAYSFVALFIFIALFSVIGLFSQKWRYRALALYSVAFVSVLFYYATIEPSNERNWQPTVEKLSYATQKENLVTIHNVRNFEYRSESDYTPAYYDKTYDLDKLEGADLVAVYWMGPSVAHIFMSFHFGADEYLSVSIETRMEMGESYSTLRGFFRQYELYYVVADERDVIKLRTNYRKNPVEDVYIYPLKSPKKGVRRLFLEYVEKMNSLKDKAEFYNTIATNCTTAIWQNNHVNNRNIALSWKILASGYLPEYLYENGRLSSKGLTFEELQKRVHANERAQRVKEGESFSLEIRK